jgi:hypothetical protein
MRIFPQIINEILDVVTTVHNTNHILYTHAFLKTEDYEEIVLYLSKYSTYPYKNDTVQCKLY